MSSASPIEPRKGHDRDEPSRMNALLPSPLPDLPDDSGVANPSFVSRKQASHPQDQTSQSRGGEVIPLRESTVEHDELLPRPSRFAPFFTLIEDTWTGEHHHPHVHYIFADDDPDPVTNAILQALEPRGEHEDQMAVSQTIDTADDPHTSSYNGKEALASEAAHRTLIIDIGPDGSSVQSFKSLTHDWQLSSASIALAPTFNEAGAAGAADSRDFSEKGEAGLMLRLEGVEHNASALSSCHENFAQEPTAEQMYILSRRVEEGEDALATMSALHERFKRDMELLSKMLHDVNASTGEQNTHDVDYGPAVASTDLKDKEHAHAHHGGI